MSKTDYDANKLFEAGGIFLFFDAPLNSEFGIDYNCWRTGENFKGVKMIPPGLHYIYFSVADKHGNIGLRNGFFHDFKVKEVIAKKWNKQNETIEDCDLSQDESETFERNKRDFDRFLGAYPFEEYKRWISLTNNIKSNFLEKLVPENKIITSVPSLIGKSFIKHRSKESNTAETKETENLFKVPANLKEAENRLPEMEQEKNTQIKFSKIPEESFPKGSNPNEITSYSIDTSYRLELLIQNQQQELNLESPEPLNVLGELQFSFICFLIGHVYDGFEQWKTLIHLLCNCDKLIKKYPDLFIQFIQVLYFEIKEMPDDFFTDIITGQNFLIVSLHNLFDNIREVNKESNGKDNSINKLNDKCEQFKNYLKEKFEFDFDLEPDEYAPVICDE